MAVHIKAVSCVLFSVFVLWLVYAMEQNDTDGSFFGGSRTWQDIAASKGRENMAKIPPEWLLSDDILAEGKKRKKLAGPFIEGLLDTQTLDITRRDSDELLQLIANGTLTSLEITMAFCKRGAYAHQLVRQAQSLSRFHLTDTP